MNTHALQKLRKVLRHSEPAYGLWVTLESPSVTEMAVGLGLDWVVIDAEHGSLDWRDIVGHLRATVRSDTVALVRVSEASESLIKRSLDLGADGVVIPHVENAADLERAVSLSRFPLSGTRGIGAERATGWGECIAEHVAEANDHVLVVPIIETVQGGKNLGSILKVPNVEMFFLGPADYSASAGSAGQWQGSGVAKQLLDIRRRIHKAGKYCGLVTTSPEDLVERRRQGFELLGVGLDAGLMRRGLRAALTAVGREVRLNPALDPGKSHP